MSGSCFKQLVIVAVLFVAVAQFQGLAQLSSASVTGVVRDTSGSVIPGVKITLQNVATSVSHNSVSNSAGNYLFLGITPGEYTLQAEATGFEVSKMPQFTLAVNHPAERDRGGFRPTRPVGDRGVGRGRNREAGVRFAAERPELHPTPLSDAWRGAGQRFTKLWRIRQRIHGRQFCLPGD